MLRTREDRGQGSGKRDDAPSMLDRRVQTARWVAFFMLCFTAIQIPFFALAALAQSGTVGSDTPVWTVPTGLALSFVLAGLTLWLLIVRVFTDELPGALLYWTSFALLAVSLPVIGLWTWTVMMAGAWWAAAFVCARGGRLWSATGVLAASPWVLGGFYEATTGGVAWNEITLVWILGLIYAPLVMSGNLASIWLYELARDAVSGREAQARLAVSEERLRFARDLHDLLGHSLSGMAVKSELAARLAERGDPAAAAEQMRTVQGSARTALREVRGAVSGYRAMDLEQELADVRGVLAASGIGSAVEGDPVDVPSGVRGLAAWMVREGVTNVVRHSAAKRCDIVLRRVSGAVEVEVRNDGAPRADAVVPGNGITGLTERVAAAGGSLSAGPGGGDATFLLRAVLPTDVAEAPVEAPADAPMEARAEAPPEAPKERTVQETAQDAAQGTRRAGAVHEGGTVPREG